MRSPPPACRTASTASAVTAVIKDGDAVRLADGTLAGSVADDGPGAAQLHGARPRRSPRRRARLSSMPAALSRPRRLRPHRSGRAAPIWSWSTAPAAAAPSTSKERRLTSRMLEEAREAPARVAALLAADGERYEALAARLRAAPPPFARDHRARQLRPRRDLRRDAAGARGRHRRPPRCRPRRSPATGRSCAWTTRWRSRSRSRAPARTWS